MTKSILISAIASMVLLFTACNSSNFKSPKEVFSTKEVSELAKENVLLVDVRDADEIAEQSYDVKNIINIPLDSIEANLSKIPKDKQVVLVCQSGGRSKQAYDILVKKGFANLANMEGGMNAWDEAGLPTKTNSNVAKTEKKACCAEPNSKDCNPDGTCKDKANCTTKTTETTTQNGATNSQNTKIEVYAFHGTNQCSTCKNMKANTKIALDDFFKNELANGTISFQIIDVDDKKNEKLAEKFEASGTALMINQIKNGKEKIIDLSDMAFEKANDKSEFIADFKSKIQALLK